MSGAAGATRGWGAGPEPLHHERKAVMTTQNSPWRNPWVIGWFAILATVLSANAVMIWLAVATNPGLVNQDYYERGRAYERTIHQRRARSAGWELSVNAPARTVAGRAATYRFVGVDKAGLPLATDAVTLHAYRPADAGADFTLAMEREAAGVYRADVVFPLKGVWDVLVSFRQEGEEHNVARRVNVLGGS